MSRELEQIRSAVRDKDVKTALELIRDHECKVGPSAQLLVFKAMCLQLSDEGSLDEIESILLSAIELDDTCLDAFIEIGWFYLSVLSDPEKGAAAFDKARILVEKFLGETVRGTLACASELRPNQDKREFAEELRRSLMAQAFKDSSP
jgi:hypothetical protein